MSNKGKYYLTTAIAYTSGKPHIGNVYEIVLADAIAPRLCWRTPSPALSAWRAMTCSFRPAPTSTARKTS